MDENQREQATPQPPAYVCREQASHQPNSRNTVIHAIKRDCWLKQTYNMPVYYQTPHLRRFHSPAHSSKQPKKSNIHLRRNESCSSTDTSNKFRVNMQLSDKRQWSLEPLQRRIITPNSAEMIRESAYWTHPELLHDPYTGNQTNDQDFHQPYWKLSQIKLCQTPTNKSNMKPRQVSCNTQISKITIFYEHLKQYLSRIFQHPAPKTQDLESGLSVPRFRTPTSSRNNQ